MRLLRWVFYDGLLKFRSFENTCIHVFVLSFVHFFIHSFVRSFIHSFLDSNPGGCWVIRYIARVGLQNKLLL